MRFVWSALFTALCINAALAEEPTRRWWVSEDGRYRIEASLWGSQQDAAGELILLQKPDGTILRVPAARLGRESQKHAAELLRQMPQADPTRGYILPDRIRVLPVILVPKGEKQPTEEEKSRFIRHLRWSQERYREMLEECDTFELACDAPHVVQARHDLAHYRKSQDHAAAWVAELCAQFRCNRFTCPYVFCILVVNPRDGFPGPGGRPCNGGVDTGCGVTNVCTHDFDLFNFQSTLQHELGHAFGLVHVANYRYEMSTTPSIMGYNRNHKTNFFEPSNTPGRLIPEDLRTLALNERVFPLLEFDPETHVPADYQLRPVRVLGPMEIPRQRSTRIQVTTESGELFGSSAGNIAQRHPRPSSSRTPFDARTMWLSDTTETGWVSVEVALPLPVKLTRIVIHSQSAGVNHAAHAVRIEAERTGNWQMLADEELPSVDAEVGLDVNDAQHLRLSFQAGPSRRVVIRGLKFFCGEHELFPPATPRSGVPSLN